MWYVPFFQFSHLIIEHYQRSDGDDELRRPVQLKEHRGESLKVKSDSRENISH
jgi:hypothetical protein